MWTDGSPSIDPDNNNPGVEASADGKDVIDIIKGKAQPPATAEFEIAGGDRTIAVGGEIRLACNGCHTAAPLDINVSLC